MKNVHPAVWCVAAALYWVCPLDFDFVPVLGWIDDAVVVCMAGWKLFFGSRPKVEQKPRAIDGAKLVQLRK